LVGCVLRPPYSIAMSRFARSSYGLNLKTTENTLFLTLILEVNIEIFVKIK